MGLAAILTLVETLLPVATNIIVAFKKNAGTGTTDVSITITQADAAFTADIAQAQAWLAAHPVTPAA